MSYEQFPSPTQSEGVTRSRNYLIYLLLFILTFFTTTLAGIQWAGKDPLELNNFTTGLTYAGAILFFLSCHEFGHYFAARLHNVNTTLPYFIPFPPVPFLLNFGTLGALIRMRSLAPSRKAMFDIGVAGPIVGFLSCLIILVVGFKTLPDPDYMLSIHPDYDFKLNSVPDLQGIPLEFGNTLLYGFLAETLADPQTQFIPPMTEIYHYPLLCVGWFGLFVTAMNLIPIGQFDGGHIAYTMFGDLHKKIAFAAFVVLIGLGLPSVLDFIIQFIVSNLTEERTTQIVPFAEYSWWAWLLWAFISYRVVGLVHPPLPDDTPLDPRRMTIGWLCFAIFVVCFSPNPFTIAI